MLALKGEIRKLCKTFGLSNVDVVFTDDRRCVAVKSIVLVERPDVDPTEESNAVSWGDN